VRGCEDRILGRGGYLIPVQRLHHQCIGIVEGMHPTKPGLGIPSIVQFDSIS